MSLLLAGMVLFCLMLFFGAYKAPATVKIEGYVYDSCGGCFSDDIPCKPCKVVLELEEYLYSELDRLGARDACKVEVHNILYSKQKQLFSQRISENKLGNIEYPVLFINDTVLYGWAQIRKEFARTVLTGIGKDDSGIESVSSDKEEIVLAKAKSDTVVYFKMTSCRSCQKSEKFLDDLVKKRGDFSLLTYDIEDRGNLSLFQAYCGKYGVNAENTSVPVVFIGDKCLEGFEEVQVFLEPYLEAGYAKDTYRMQ